MASDRAHDAARRALSEPSSRSSAPTAAAAAERGEDGTRRNARRARHRLDRRPPAARDRCARAARRALRRDVAGDRRTRRGALGLSIDSLDELVELDIAIDGADQIDPAGWLVKGGGGAHTREKIVAAAAERFVVIASAEKAVEELHPPIPVELLAFGLSGTLGAIAPARVRQGTPLSPDGGVIADHLGAVQDAGALAARLADTTGLVEHGLFPPQMTSLVLIARPGVVERRELA